MTLMADKTPTSEVRVSASRDGVERITIRVEFRMSRDDMVTALAGFAIGLQSAELGDLPSREALNIVRRLLRADATLVRDYDISASPREREWAERQVSRFWPSDA